MIIINNEELLRKPCEDVKPEEVAELLSILELELDNANKLGANGIGLAAPQIGIYKKIAIVRMGNPSMDINLINSRIEKGYDQQIFRSEGCLSFPGRVEDTMRYQECYIVDNLTYPNSFVVKGMLAVVVQHELDHINGVLLPDRAIVKLTKNQVKVGPNDPCICGSNKKYKKCCRK